jgi:hypothetical protein
MINVSDDESFSFVFSTEDRRQWVESLFLVFDIKDIFEVLDSKDILLVLDSTKRQEVITKYREELKLLETARSKVGLGDQIDEKKQKEIESLKIEYDKKIKNNEENYTLELQSMYKEQGEILGKVRYYDQLLSNYADNLCKS